MVIVSVASGSGIVEEWSSLNLKNSIESLSGDGLPIVVAHGMGDSCFNPGMVQITKKIGEFAGGVYR